MVAYETCFNIHKGDVAMNSILPDLEGFELQDKMEKVNGHNCRVWYYEEKIGDKLNKYWYYEDIGNFKPVRFYMIGYNVVLQSHFDEYIYDYISVEYVRPTAEDFSEPETKWTCIDFPGPGSVVGDSHKFLSTRFPRTTASEFKQFVKDNKKCYNDVEYKERQLNFLRNKARVEKVNSENRSYKLKLNHLADRSESELRAMMGLKRSQKKDFAAHRYTPSNGVKPASVDWREKGAVTPVKDQCMCGSCWTYGTVGVLEGQYFLKYGKLVKFSEQNLLDCSWNFGNDGCNGGEDFRAYGWMLHNGGLMTDEDYGHYLGIDGWCHFNKSAAAVKITDYVLITPGSVEELEDAVANVGPISVGIAVTTDFLFYAEGVFDNPECSSAVEDQAHAVLAVGYGTENGKDYWLIKNSWSTYWGDNGYVKIARKNNICGVATAASYPILA